MHFHCSGVDFTLRINILVEVFSREPAINKFNATDFDYAVPI
jgi:hypothetical protein